MADASAADAATVAQIAERQAQQVVDEVVGRIDAAIAQQIERQDRRFDELFQTVRLAAATLTRMVEQLSDAGVPRPSADLPPRPAELDAACAASPSDGLQPVRIMVYGREVTHFVSPGSDPAEVWQQLCQQLAERGAGGVAWQN